MRKIKLIKPDTDLTTLKMSRFDWDVVIDDIPYYVVKIDEYYHSISSNEFSDQLWAYPREQEPSYDNLIKFTGRSFVQWGITCTPQLKTKYDKTEARVVSGVLITRNNKPFYVVSGDINYGVSKAQSIIGNIDEHPLELNQIDFDKKMIGRKIWWRSEPGIITSWIPGQACIIIEPDGIDGFKTPAEFMDEDCDDYYENNYVKTNIFDDHIWWFRD